MRRRASLALSLLLAAAPLRAVSSSASASAGDDFSVFDEGEQAPGRETWTWPEGVRFDPGAQRVALSWSSKSGPGEEALSFDDIIRMERARPFEAHEDEIFMLLADGRRILVSRGLDVQAHAVLIPAMLEIPLKELAPGSGHFPAVGASGPDIHFVIGRGGGLEIRAVELRELDDQRFAKANYSAVEYDEADDIDLNNEGGGELKRQEIDIVIKQRMTLIRRCYTRELRRDASLQGTVKVRFVIDRDGSIKYAAVRSSQLQNSIVESCVIDEIKRLRFPPPDGDGTIVVTYPFTFHGG
jgi:TonB family protein